MSNPRIRRRRTEAQREAFSKLSGYHRKLIMEQYPNEIEEDDNLRMSTRRALEFRFGPTQWDATLAVIAEADEIESVDIPHASPLYDEGVILREIGAELGCGRERVNQIIQSIFAKLLKNPKTRDVLYELMYGEKCISIDETSMNEAIDRAYKAKETELAQQAELKQKEIEARYYAEKYSLIKQWDIVETREKIP